jgi:serine-type D-Ala-D-Ala carboxypeptidase/endopeptidase
VFHSQTSKNKEAAMRMIGGIPFVASLVFTIFPLAAMAKAEAPMTDEEIRSVLKDRIDRARRSVGIVVGIIDDKCTRIIAYGKPSLASNQTVDSDTVYEIGSITKVFTATLLADMAKRGDVSLDDPISKYLPKSVKTPTRNGKEITLRSLATHTSGLPRDGNIHSAKMYDSNDPLATYTVDMIYDFLSGYALTRDIGAKYEYSNFGAGLLGHILALQAGMDYEDLVRTRICNPLGMESTRITLSPKMKAHLATGHNSFLKPVPNWQWPCMQGCGSLLSTVPDLLKFVEANLGLQKTPLTAVMEMTHVAQHDRGSPDEKIALGWKVSKSRTAATLQVITHSSPLTRRNARELLFYPIPILATMTLPYMY